MKDFNIAKYLKENHLGPHAILGGYVDLHALKEEEEMELDTEIPYEGPERKVDGFGDKFKQTNAVEEVNNNHKFKVVIPSAGVTRNHLQFINDNDIKFRDVSDEDDWDDQRTEFTASNEEVLKLMIAKFYSKRLGLGKKEMLDLINRIEPISSPVEEADGPPFGMPDKSEENPWMNEVDGTDAYKFGNWTCYYDYPGVLAWSYKDVPLSKLAVYATPDWESDGTTPIQIDIDEETQDKMTLKQSEFADFNEYAKAMKPYLDRIEDLESDFGSLAPSDDSMDTDDSVNPFPSIMKEKENSVIFDKGWQYDDDEVSNDDRFADLGGDQIKSAIKSLMDDGFDSREIAQFVVDTIKGFKSFKK